MPDAPAIPTVRYRDLNIRLDLDARATRAADDDRIPIAMSSETPVERYDWWSDKRYFEVLEHSSSAIDLSYARDGLPFLVDHDTREQVGLVEDVSIAKDGHLRGLVRFSRSQKAQDIRADMVDGIRKKISVGYRIDDNNIEVRQEDGDAIPTRFIKRWMPMEASSVPIPADYTVGVNRAADRDVARPHVPGSAAPKAEEKTMSEELRAGSATAGTENGVIMDTTNTRTGSTGAGRVSVRMQDDGEMKDLSTLAEMHKVEHVFMRGIQAGQNTQEIRSAMIKEIQERMAKGPQVGGVVDFSEREQRNYSLVRAMVAAADGEECFEMDVSREIAKKLGRDPQNQGRGVGIFVPTNIRAQIPNGANPLTYRAGLDSATATKGTELKFDVPGSFIDLLRNKARVMQLGATVLSGLNGPVTFPKQTGAGTASWVGENPGSNVSESNLLLSTVTLTAKTLQSTTSFSRQLLRQSVVDVENLVRADLAAIHALAIDLAAINGSGSGNQPAGIFTNTSVNVVTIGANGGVPTYAHLVDMESAVESDNADIGAAAGYLTTPGIKGKLKKTEMFATTNGVPVWTGGQEGAANGYQALSSNQVPSNFTKGTSTTVCHGIVFGYWPQLIVGEWGVMEIITDPYALKKQGMIEVTSFQMADIALRHPESFAVVKDALTA